LKSQKSGKKWDLSQIRRPPGKKVAKSGKKWQKVGYNSHSCVICPPMDIPQILEFVDRAVYAKTDKHLNDLQRKIITGILNGQKYAEVSKNYGYSADHVKKVSHDLLHILSDVFGEGEKVKKGNLESVLERQINVRINFSNKNTRDKNIIEIGNLNNCAAPSKETLETSKQVMSELPQKPENKTKINTIDKLRLFGLSDEQIAEALDIPLDVVKQIKFDE
jgi:hypothetical protein